MNSYTEYAPTPLLSSFIRCYSLRSVVTEGFHHLKPLHSLHELCMGFCIFENELSSTDKTEEIPSASCSYISGISTQCSHELYFNKPGQVFCIHFKPNGFYKLFGRSPKHLLNKTIEAAEVVGPLAEILNKLILTCCSPACMKVLADAFLLQQMHGQNATVLLDGITDASNIIMNNISINTAQLAQYVNMSLRNFERCFVHQVGITAKLYCRIVRFNNALMLKINSTKKNWASIAQTCGYFDQMHLIKDFKQFTGCSPSIYMKQSALAGASVPE